MDRQVNALDFSTSTVFKKVKDISRPVYRYPYFDALKAIAIFMVVLQHCYIYLGNGMYEDSIVNQTVSMISVPAFMLVSGYFYFTGSKNLEKFFKREGQLILPFILWSFFYFLAFHDIFYREIVYLLMLFNVPVIVELPFICMIGYSILTIVISLIIYGFIARTPFKSLIYGKFSKNAPCAFRQYLNNA